MCVFQGRMAEQGVITVELKDKLLQEHKDTELSLDKKHEVGKQQQLRNLEEKMAALRKRRFEKLKDQQEKYKNDVRVML